VCSPADAAQNQCATAGFGQGIANCQLGRIVEVDMSYDQPLYLPLITNLFQTKPNGTRLLEATAQATCEQ
jgi:hypothetical protein